MALIYQEGSASTPNEVLFSLIENIGPSILNISERPIDTSDSLNCLYSGTHTTAGKITLKRLRLVPEEHEMLLFLLKTEAWRKLSHPHVLQLLGVAEISGYVHLVSPHIANGSLLAFAKRNSDAPLPRLLGETADAIAFLHERDIIHGDIKGENILVSDDVHALLCDFSLPMKTSSATAPETKNSFKSDTYSFGTTIIEMLTGNAPFWTFATDTAVIRAAFFEHKQPERPPFVPKASNLHSYLWEIAQMCIVAEPDARPDMVIILSLFEHMLLAARTSPKPQMLSASQLRKNFEQDYFSMPYTFVRDIGSSIIKISDQPFSDAGGFAALYSGTHITAGKVALKRLRCDQDVREVDAFLQEAETWSQLQHPYILKFLGICKSGGYIHLVSPFMSNGTLRLYLKENSNADRPRLLRETADAIVFIHQSGLIHGDLKAENVLVSDDIHALLFDFGQAHICEGATTTVTGDRGTLRWMSPELWNGNPKSPASDTYSFGMTVIEILTGKAPFAECKTDLSVLHAIFVQRKPIVRPLFDTTGLVASLYLWDVAEMCTVAEPEKRPEMVIVHLLLDQFTWAGDSFSELPLIPAPRLRNLLEHARRAATRTRNPPASTIQSIPPRRPIRSRPVQVAAPAPKDKIMSGLIADAEDLGPRLTKTGLRPAKQGGFSEVWQGKLAPNDKEVAIKCLRAVGMDKVDPRSNVEERLDKRMKREMKVWMPLENPYILQCLGFAMVNERPSLISPWCKNGNAREFLDAHPKCDRKAMVSQVAEGLVYLHGRTPPIVHYDIYLPNIMISDDEKAMLTDFGVAKVVDGLRTGLTTVNPTAISLRFSSPEAVAGSDRNVKSDVYSFGCVALEIMTNKAPFYNLKTQPAIVRAKCEGKVPDPAEFPELPANDPLWSLLRKCWDMNPEKRPTMKEVLKELEKQGYRA